MEELPKILEQIRTVHFTLTIACLALIMATEFSTPSTVQRAHQDLVAIQSAVQSLSRTWPDDLARTAYAQTIRERSVNRGFSRHIRAALTIPRHYGGFDIPPFTVEGVFVGEFSVLEPPAPDTTEPAVIDFKTPPPFQLYGDSFGGTKGFKYNVGPATFELEENIGRFAEAWDFLRRPHFLVVPTRLQERMILGFRWSLTGKRSP